jgi:hypothetical protein
MQSTQIIPTKQTFIITLCLYFNKMILEKIITGFFPKAVSRKEYVMKIIFVWKVLSRRASSCWKNIKEI